MTKSMFAPALLVVLLAACGGGGGGGGGGAGGNNSVGAGAPAAVVITQANAPTVGAHGLDAAQDNSGSTSASLITGVQVDGQASMPGPAMIAAIAQRMGQRAAGLPLASGVSVDETAQCDNGGSARISGSVASSNGLNTGDNLTIAATNCSEVVDGVLVTINGTLRFDVASGFFPGSGQAPYHVVLRTTAVGLSIRIGSNVATSDGDMAIDITTSSSSSQIMVVSGNSLSSTATVGGTQRIRTLTAYTQRVTLSGTTVTGALSGSVATTSTRLGSGGGSFTVSTPQELSWTTTSDVPFGGQLKVVGASNSAVLLTFSVTGVTVQVDANGDGVYESSSTASVSQLRALL